MSKINQCEGDTLINAGLVLCCLDCKRRKLITDLWLSEAVRMMNGQDMCEIIPRLRCECGSRGKVFIDKPKNGRIDFLNSLSRLQERVIDVAEFSSEMQRLALEGNLLAAQWLSKSSVAGYSGEKTGRYLKSKTPVKPNYNTMQWVDWDLGISRRQGKRNKIYE